MNWMTNCVALCSKRLASPMPSAPSNMPRVIASVTITPTRPPDRDDRPNWPGHRSAGASRCRRLAALGPRPAVLTGWEDLQRFLEHGFSAFKHMKGAAQFLETIRQREKAILDRIFAAEPNPISDIHDVR